MGVWANLRRSAESLRATGDPRSLGQIMADLMVERTTGQQTASAIPLEIGLVMTPDALIGVSDRPARLAEGTPLPARTARDLAMDPRAPTWLRRIFTDPVSGVATTTDPGRHRFFTGALARLLDVRDQASCRHPGCDRPCEHRDHVVRATDGGPTEPGNGQGLCAGYNHLKEIPGWQHRVVDTTDGRHVVEVRTPTGHRYHSHAPPALPPPG